MIFEHLLFLIALLLYAISAIFFLISSLKQAPSRLGAWLFRSGFLIHTLSAVWFFSSGTVLSDRADYCFWVAWGVAFLYTASDRYFRFPLMNVLVACVVSIFFVSSSVLIHQDASPHLVEKHWFMLALHAVPILVAEISLVLAFIVSAVFLIQERRLKRHLGHSLKEEEPSMAGLERFNRRLVNIAFAALTIAILSGVLWGAGLKRGFPTGDIWQWGALFLWICLALLLELRIRARWSARLASLITVYITAIFFTVFLVMSFITGRSVHEDYFSGSNLHQSNSNNRS